MNLRRIISKIIYDKVESIPKFDMVAIIQHRIEAVNADYAKKKIDIATLQYSIQSLNMLLAMVEHWQSTKIDSKKELKL